VRRVTLVIVMSCAALSACSSATKLWPFGKRAAPGPTLVNEVVLEGVDGPAPAATQYWKRNALVIDLQALSGTGRMVAKPREGTTWPVRVALRTRPGSFGEVEVQGTQRAILPVPDSGTRAVDFELAPSLLRTDTPQLTILWRSRPDPDAPSAVAAPLPADAATAVPAEAPAVAPAATPAPAPADQSPPGS
jgi:hypothetical protein